MNEINFNIEDVGTIDLSMDVGIKEIYPPIEDLEVMPTKEQQVFNHENSYGYDNVTINPIPEEYIIPDGTKDINSNGTHNVNEYESVNVNVEVQPLLQDKEVTPTKEVQNITSDENFDGLNEVTVNAIPNEYIIPSGSLDITENGVTDVTSYAEVNVNIEIPEPTLQDKSITITENGTQNIVADDGFDGLNSVEVITNVASGEGSSNSINVFAQENEPSTKDGIWLQTNKTYKKVAIEELKESTDWNIEFTRADIPYKYVGGAIARVGDSVYMFGGWGGQSTAYKYDILTDTYTQLPNVPIQLVETSGVAVSNNVYMGMTQFIKYDTTSNKYTTLATPPSTLQGACLVLVGDYIYSIGKSGTNTASTKIHKYDINANTWTTLSVTSPQYFVLAYAFAVGTDIYCLASRTFSSPTDINGKSTKDYKFDTITQTFTELGTSPTDFVNSCGYVEGNNVYLFGNAYSSYNGLANYRYNILTNTYTRMSDLPHSVHYGLVTKQNNEYMIVGGGTGTTNAQKIMSLYLPTQELKTYNEDVVILVEDENSSTKAKIFNTDNLINFDDFVSYYFKDVIYQSKDGTNDTTIPTYYGDGTQWIKFKN